MPSNTKACGQCSQTLAAMTLFRSMQKDQAEVGVTKHWQRRSKMSQANQDDFKIQRLELMSSKSPRLRLEQLWFYKEEMVFLDLCKKGIKPTFILHLLQERFYPSQVRPTFPYRNLDVIQFRRILETFNEASFFQWLVWFNSKNCLSTRCPTMPRCLLARQATRQFEIPSNSTNQETPLNWCIMYDALRHHDVSLDFDGMVRLLARGCSTPLWDEIGCACSRLDHVR